MRNRKIYEFYYDADNQKWVAILAETGEIIAEETEFDSLQRSITAYRARKDYPLAKDCCRCKKCCLEPTARACWSYTDDAPQGIIIPKGYREADMF